MAEPVRCVIVADPWDIPSHRIWGTGGWEPPDQRNARDWLILLRFLGWSVDIARAGGHTGIDPAELVIVASETASNSEAWGQAIGDAAARGAVVVEWSGPDAARRLSKFKTKEMRWVGPGSAADFSFDKEVEVTELDTTDGEPWCIVGGRAVIAAKRNGDGSIVTLGFEPSAAQDECPSIADVLRHVVTQGIERTVDRLDFSRSMILRMDDPGGAQNVHLSMWMHPKLDTRQWAALGSELQRHSAKLSIAYVPGWIDDGDATRGELRVDGHQVPREAGQVFASHRVWYRSAELQQVSDYQAEYQGIKRLMGAGLADVELHGYTHMWPDTRPWMAASDRYNSMSWYRELGHITKDSGRDVLRLGRAALHEIFGVYPSTLVPPGDEWSNEALELALDAGMNLVDSYYLGIRHGNDLCWSTYVRSPYLDEVDASFFDGGWPVVGYFHDHDIATKGLRWLTDALDGWRDAGVESFLTFRDLAMLLNY